MGIDRHGAVMARPVDVRVSNHTADVCFVGTRAAFGAFHPNTMLIDSAGVSRPAKSIVDAETLATFRFERAIDSGASTLTDAACELIWRELDAISIAQNGKESLFRVLDAAETPRSSRPKSMTPHTSEGHRYVTIDRGAFSSALRTSGLSVLLDASRQLRSTPNESIEVERESCPILLWLMSHLSTNGKNFRLAFDFIQHSSTVTMDLMRTSSALEQARTAFIAGTAHAVSVAWEEKLWNPVSSGFVVAARTTSA